MSTYEPGTVAVAAVCGVPNVRVTLDPNGDWFSHVEVEGRIWHEVEDVTDVRPLVVLDLAINDVTPEQMGNHLVAVLRDGHAWNEHIADQIEAQTKPPRIPEPTGFAPVVEAGVAQHAERLRWSRNEQGYWFCQNDDEYARNWGELVDPVLVRDGIEDGAR